MYELIVERSFSAAHCLREYDGACARVHGHNYRVEVSVVGEELMATGFLIDFGDLKTICEGILEQMDHRMLNDLPQFRDQNPTSENIARLIYEGMKTELGPLTQDARVSHVRVWETPGQSAIYRES